MKYQKGLIAVLSLSLVACGQTNLTSKQPDTQLPERTARIESLIPTRVQGQARQALISFLQSYPGDLQKISQVILVEDSALLNQQNLGIEQVKIYSNLSETEEQQIKPFHQTRTVKPLDATTVQPLNLALCQSSGSGGYFSQKTATNYYGGFAANMNLPYSVSQSAGNTAYMYGGFNGIFEIGMQYSQTTDLFSAYMSINNVRPQASSSYTDYDARGIDMPIIRRNRGGIIQYQIFDVTDANDPNTFYLSATFDGTLVGYKSSPTSDPSLNNLVASLRPKEYLGYQNRYNGITMKAVTALAFTSGNTSPASMTGASFSNMQVYVPTPQTYMFDNPVWDYTRTAESCVNNQVRVNASSGSGYISTNIAK